MKNSYDLQSRYVPALRDPRPRVIEIEPVQLPNAPTTVLLPTANYTDRAQGFSLATMPLAGATGLVTVLIGISAFSVPLLSVAALLLALGGFCAAWLVAYIAHTLISPDGTMFAHTVLTWRYLRAEQRERHARYRAVQQ